MKTTIYESSELNHAAQINLKTTWDIGYGVGVRGRGYSHTKVYRDVCSNGLNFHKKSLDMGPICKKKFPQKWVNFHYYFYITNFLGV